MDKLSAEEEKVQKDLKKAMSFIDQGLKMISEAAKMKHMMQNEAGQKLIEFGSGKHEETEKRLRDIAVERTRIQEKLMKCSGSKKMKSTN